MISSYSIWRTILIFRRTQKYNEKQKLFLRTKQKGLFWSYDKKLVYSKDLDILLIENILKYGDIEELKKLFLLYGKRVIKKVWKEKLINDTHFIKLNYFLARIFFGMNVEADFFKGGISDRGKKLRTLAS